MESASQESGSWTGGKIAAVAVGVVGLGALAVLGWQLWGSDSDFARKKSLKKARGLYEQAYNSKETGEFDKAEELFEESLKLLQTNLTNPYDDTIAQCMFELSQCCLATQREETAEAYAQEALQILKSNHGDDSPALVDAMINLANIFMVRRKLVHAEGMAKSAKEIIEFDQKDIDHSGLSAIYRVLSGICLARKEIDEAERLSLLALEEFKSANMTDRQQSYRHQLEAYVLLGKIYSKQGRKDKAEEVFLQLIEVAKKELGEDDLEVAMAYRTLAEFYESKKKVNKAIKAHKQAIEVVRRKHGDNDSNLFAFKNHLAHFYCDHRMDDKAAELYSEMKEMTCLPTPSSSKYLITKLFAFTFNRSPDQPLLVVPLYVGELLPTPSLPSDAYLEVEFENPADPHSPIIVPRPLTEEDTEGIVVVSRSVSGVKPRMYEIVIRIYEDQSKKKKLGEHHQMCKSVFDTDKIRTEEDVFKQIPKDSFLNE